MINTTRFGIVVGGLVLAAMITLSSCGANGPGTDSVQLSPAAAEGRSISNRNGCGACHGTSGEGGAGPAFANLFGSTIELDDGSTVSVDRQYVIESIKQPTAKRAEGFTVLMPPNGLTDAQIDLIVAYIEALAEVSAGSIP